ncbi:DNA-binding GntR family transcriptional regulator [Paraburkholderia sp. BL6669N2]|uniref:GntR family transcriptional regulator n=1 Tax=Paraburkholderia sp. BL6669N2 TaxID=1938807 RepID=UPI000E38AA7F|nr:GntR family transcriptional regulator [Paraburkholderia sp. BL6669N2]REG50988.1 DNA-binding GntR family transcriptional regulator [Paraburkholderia sp. BL6669N2]
MPRRPRDTTWESPADEIAEASPIAGTRAPRYAELARVLIERINSGTYAVGQSLPPETELCVMFGASRHTVREAIRILSEQGMVSRRQGVGTIVTASSTQARYTATLSSLSDLMQHLDATELHFLSDEEVAADSVLAELLECPVGQRWIRIRALRVLKRSSEVVSAVEMYVQLRFAGLTEMLGKTQNSVYRLIEDHYHTRVVECRQDVVPIIISGEEAKKLHVPSGTPGLHVTRHYLDDKLDILSVSINRYPKNRFRFQMRWRLS